MKKTAIITGIFFVIFACKTKKQVEETADPPVGSISVVSDSSASFSKAACDGYLTGSTYQDSLTDPFDIVNARIDGRNLYVTVSYNGGCGPTQFRLLWNGAMMKSFPPQLSMKLHFDDNDPCRGVTTKELCFDVGTINNGESYTLLLEGWDSGLVFE